MSMMALPEKRVSATVLSEGRRAMPGADAMTRSIVFVIASVILAMSGCAESRTPPPETLPGIPDDTRLADLSGSQRRQLCEWWVELAGGPNVTLMCLNGQVSFSGTVDTCVSDLSMLPVDCPTLVGSYIRCNQGKYEMCPTNPNRWNIPACNSQGCMAP
jgi:hypothetical protein